MPEYTSGYTPLHHAATKNPAARTHILINPRENIGTPENKNYTTLHRAAWHNSVEIAEILVNAGGQKTSKTAISVRTCIWQSITAIANS